MRDNNDSFLEETHPKTAAFRLQDEEHLQTAKVLDYDVVVVGGGIAGIAAAERLAREAQRQKKRLDLILIEKHSKLGMESSGSLEGWYHTGALYTRLSDPLPLCACLGAVEDLLNWYKYDSNYFPGCNYHINKNGNLNLKPDSGPGERWFEARILYHMNEEADEKSLAYVRHATTEWKGIKQKIQQRYRRCFEDWHWYTKNTDRRSSQISQCPHAVDIYEHIIDKNSRKKKDKIALSEKFLSLDAVMNSDIVMQDLTQSADTNGVKIETEWEFLRVIKRTYKDSVEIRAIEVINRKESQKLHLRAKQYIFASGASMAEDEIIRDLRLDRGLQRRQSVLLTAKAPKGQTTCRGEVVLAYRPSDDINYVVRRFGELGKNEQFYVVCGDSNSLEPNASETERLEAAHRLLEKVLDNANPHWGWLRSCKFTYFVCRKTEFGPESTADRQYVYWHYPEISFAEGAIWNKLRRGIGSQSQETHQRTLQEDIRKAAQDFLIKHSLYDDFENVQEKIRNAVQLFLSEHAVLVLPSREELHFKDSPWALRRLLHFALLHATRPKNASQPNRLKVYRELADQIFDLYSNMTSSPRPNYLVLVPGKFSMFPTLANHAYIEMEIRGLFRNLEGKDETHPAEGWPRPQASQTDDKKNAHKDFAKRKVAQPRAAALLFHPPRGN